MFDIAKRRQLQRLYRTSFSPTQRIKILSTLASATLVAVVLLILTTTFLFAWYAKDLPQPDKIKRVEGYSTIIYDRNGKTLYDVYADQNRIPVDLKDVPDYLKKATIAIEDKDFYKHKGFDPKGIARAALNIFLHRNLQGGSTLTQQLVKNVLLSSERTLGRKIKEFILSVQIERKYSKDQILQMYLNEAPYGGTAWGVETASQLYFGRSTKKLNLVESAILAGFPQSPTNYSPYGSDPSAYVWRTTEVLRRMREDGYINSNQEKKALAQLKTIKFTPQSAGIKAPHFVMYVKQKLIEMFGEKMVEQGGLRVTTTLDLDLQNKAQSIVSTEIDKLKYEKVGNGAAIVLNPQNGEILSMVGSKDYFAKDYDGNVNVTLSLRQPGSSIKPVTYATALKKGFTAATLLFDTKTVFPNQGLKDYIPENYDGKDHGPQQVRYALANSLNIPAVKMLADVGLKDMLETAYDMGLTSLEPSSENLKRFGLALTLGGGEVRLIDLASAYSAFGNGGYKIEPKSILKVANTKNEVLFEQKNTKKSQAISPEVAYIISQILTDDNARQMTFGTGSYLAIPGFDVAVKTGTTDDKRDNWTIGWAPDIVVGVWVGNNDNSQMARVASGVTGASPIWNGIIRYALTKVPKATFQRPGRVVSLEIDALSGGLPVDGQPKRTEYFIKGTEPTDKSPIYKKLKVSKQDNKKLANDVEIKSGEYDEKEFIVFSESDPVSTDGKNRWQEAIDAYINSVEPYKSDQKYHPPTEVSQSKMNDVVVKINSPSDHQKLDTNDVKIEAQGFSLNEVIKMIIQVDGNEKNSTINSSISTYVNLSDGPHTIKVIARDSKGNEGSSEIKIGVKKDWDFKEPQPTPTTNPSPTPIPRPD